MAAVNGYLLLSSDDANRNEAVLRTATARGARWAGRLTGQYKGFISVEASDWAALEATIEHIMRGFEDLPRDLLKGGWFKPFGIKRGSVPEHWSLSLAFIRVTSKGRRKVARQARKKDPTHVAAVSVVFGVVDVIAEIHAPGPAEMAAAFTSLGGIQGIHAPARFDASPV